MSFCELISCPLYIGQITVFIFGVFQSFFPRKSRTTSKSYLFGKEWPFFALFEKRIIVRTILSHSQNFSKADESTCTLTNYMYRMRVSYGLEMIVVDRLWLYLCSTCYNFGFKDFYHERYGNTCYVPIMTPYGPWYTKSMA